MRHWACDRESGCCQAVCEWLYLVLCDRHYEVRLADVVAEVVAIRAVEVVAGPDSGFPQPEEVIGPDLDDVVLPDGGVYVSKCASVYPSRST